MDPMELLLTGARAFAIYVIMLIVIRLLGKRTVGNFSAFDLLVALMLGEVVDEIIYGDVSFAQGLVAIGVISAVEYVNVWLSGRSEGWAKIVEGQPTPVVLGGELVEDGMRKEHMNRNDVLAALRLQGVDDPREVKRATVETDGEVSVIRQEWAEPVQQADVEEAAKATRSRSPKARRRGR
jgi:uncharacterized membrane protein YcaP (DUF421 family)